MIVINDLPEKYHHFRSAPEKDSDGDNLVIRFNRKDGSHTLSSEKDGKKKKSFFIHKDEIWIEKARDKALPLYIFTKAPNIILCLNI